MAITYTYASVHNLKVFFISGIFVFVLLTVFSILCVMTIPKELPNLFSLLYTYELDSYHCA